MGSRTAWTFFSILFCLLSWLTSFLTLPFIIKYTTTPETSRPFYHFMWLFTVYKGLLVSLQTIERIVSPLYCVSSWQLANSWISLQAIRNYWIFLHTLLGYCLSYLNPEIRKAKSIGPIYIEHIVSNPSSSPCPLKYFISAHLYITRPGNHFPIPYSNSIPYRWHLNRATFSQHFVSYINRHSVWTMDTCVCIELFPSHCSLVSVELPLLLE